jgi:hypothetical protein
MHPRSVLKLARDVLIAGFVLLLLTFAAVRIVVGIIKDFILSFFS